MADGIVTTATNAPTEGPWFEAIYSALRNVIQRNEKTVSDDADSCCRSLAKAFANYNVVDFSVDYGKAYKGLSLFVSLDNGLEFDCRTEVGSPDHSLSFFILRGNEPFYGNIDTLDGFATHVANYLRTVHEYNSTNSEESAD